MTDPDAFNSLGYVQEQVEAGAYDATFPPAEALLYFDERKLTELFAEQMSLLGMRSRELADTRALHVQLDNQKKLVECAVGSSLADPGPNCVARACWNDAAFMSVVLEQQMNEQRKKLLEARVFVLQSRVEVLSRVGRLHAREREGQARHLSGAGRQR